MRELISSLGRSPTRSPTWEELGQVISWIPGKLSWLPMNGQTLITALVSNDRAMQVTENMVIYEQLLWPLFLARGHAQEIRVTRNCEMLHSTPFPTSYKAVSGSKMLGAVLSTSFQKLKDSPVYISWGGLSQFSHLGHINVYAHHHSKGPKNGRMRMRAWD